MTIAPLRAAIPGGRASPAPGRRPRALAALAIGLFAAIWVWGLYRNLPAGTPSDFDYAYQAIRSVLDGQDPYAAAHQRHAADSTRWEFALPFMGPTVLSALPLVWLPPWLARAAFAGVSAALFAYTMSRRGWWRLTACLSGGFLLSTFLCQWEPLLVAAALDTRLGFALAFKPTVGFALWLRRPNIRSAIAVAGVFAVSLAVMPHWPAGWRATVSGMDSFVPPVMRVGGVLLLLALLRWREPSGRLLAAMALVPQTSLVYATLPAVLVAQNFRELATLSVLSFVAVPLTTRLSPGSSFAGHLDAAWPALLALCYLPPLIMVLRRPERSAANSPQPA